jgi:pimeloyl-ACP methyl ester carboxylesterase
MSTTTSKDGTIIGYDKVGKGPVLIIIAGATQFRAFDPNLAALAKLLALSFTVITYDRRGRGESTDTPPYAPAREIEDIAALVAVGGGEPRFSVIHPVPWLRWRRPPAGCRSTR